MKFYARYISKSPVIIGNKSDFEEKRITCNKFYYQQLTIGMQDAIRHKADRALHLGLEFIVEGEAPNKEVFIDISNNIVEIILNLVGFSSLGYCSPARLINVTESADESTRNPSTFYTYPNADVVSSGFKIPFDASLFAEVFSHYDVSTHQQLVMRTLSWLRKGLNEEDGVDKFFFFWLGLEVIKSLVDGREESTTNFDEWDGINRIFNEKLKNNEFSRIKIEIKEQLFNGTYEPDAEFISEINNCNELLLKSLLYSLFEVLGLDERDIDRIFPNAYLNHIEKGMYCLLIGELDSFPSNFDALMTQYPHVGINPQSIRDHSPSPYDLNTMISTMELELENMQNNNFRLSELQYWSNRHSLLNQEITPMSFRIKDFRKDNLPISFDVGKDKINSNKDSAIFKPWRKSLEKWTPPGKIAYLFLSNNKGAQDNLVVLGSLCFSQGGNIIFFPGFEHNSLSELTRTYQIGENYKFYIDHFTFLNGNKKWHITGFDATYRKKEFSHKVREFSGGLYYWFGMSVRQDVFFETVCKKNVLQYNCPSSVIDKMKMIFSDSRENCDDYVIYPNDVRTEKNTAYYHFDFYYSKNELVKETLGTTLTPSELLKPRFESEGVPMNRFDIFIPGLEGKIMINLTLISGNISNPIILVM